jgi:transcription antitermination protein NusB
MSKLKHKHFRGLGRELAMQFLFQFDITKEDFDDGALIRFFKQIEASGQFDKAQSINKSQKYTEIIVSGVVENIEQIDSTIDKYLSKSWSWERIPPVNRSILRVATYEMLFSDKAPPIVAINEAVELVKFFGDPDSKGFINALLNNIKNSLDRDPRTA